MSKLRMDTRHKILDKALEMFNERGIEYVGLRELAGVLGLRVSNITYYFPTKDDLVYQLSLELAKKNASVIVAQQTLTMAGFFDMLYQAFQNQIQFRCLLLSVVHIMKQNKHIATKYKKTQRIRNDTIRSNLNVLEKGGYLEITEDFDIEFLVSAISLVSRFWISEAAISFRESTIEEDVNYYLKILGKLLRPYATAKAKKEMENFLAQLNLNKI